MRLVCLVQNEPSEGRRRRARTDSRVERRRQTGGRCESSEELPSAQGKFSLSTNSVLNTTLFVCTNKHPAAHLLVSVIGFRLQHLQQAAAGEPSRCVDVDHALL